MATSAVIWTNGQRRVIGVDKLFTIGDTSFRLAGLGRTVAKIRVVGGAFEGGSQTIRVDRGEIVTLTNIATGVQYVLSFTLARSASSGAPSSAASTSGH